MTKKNAMIENMIATRDALHAQKPPPPVSELEQVGHMGGNRRHNALRTVAIRAQAAQAAAEKDKADAARKIVDTDGNTIPVPPSETK